MKGGEPAEWRVHALEKSDKIYDNSSAQVLLYRGDEK